MKYSIKLGILKALKSVAIFAVPVLIDAFIIQFPEIAQLSVGGVLILIWNFLKVRGVFLFRSV